MGMSTHVLDTAQGRPAEGITVELQRRPSGRQWETIGGGTTNEDGRVADLLDGSELVPADYRLIFHLELYLGPDCFFPEATIHFRVLEIETHYHVPLLLSPFGYSTYRGS